MTKQKRKCDENAKKAIWDVLTDHYGLDNLINAKTLRTLVNLATGIKRIDSREIRNCISEMRKEGNLICSLAGRAGNQQSGYYLPATLDEYETYRKFYVSYAKDIFETIRAQDREAKLTFSREWQPVLFDDLPEE